MSESDTSRSAVVSVSPIARSPKVRVKGCAGASGRAAPFVHWPVTAVIMSGLPCTAVRCM
jgi:hypothetical protein